MPRVEIDETILKTVDGSTGPASGASVAVHLRGTTTAATVYVAPTGGTTRSNPLTSGANGNLDGWVDEGSYDLAVSIGGVLVDTIQYEAWRAANVRAFGATGDVAQDATSQLAAALAGTAGATLYIPDGTYTFTVGQLVVPNNTKVVASPGATFKPTGAGDAITLGSSTVGTYRSLTVNATEGAQTVTMSTSDAATFSAGDMVIVRDDTALGGITPRIEPNIVQSVATGVLTLKWPINFGYLTAQSARVGKVTAPAINAHWDGGFFDLTNVPADGLNIDYTAVATVYGIGCTTRNVKCQSWPRKVIQHRYSLGCIAENIIGLAPSAVTSGEGYVAQAFFSRDSTLRDIWGRNARHVADVTGGSDSLLENIHAVGRTTDTTCAALLHGLNSKRVRVDGVWAENVDIAFGAGNVTFGADYDFEATGINGVGCDTDVSVTQGCAGFNVAANARRSVKRAAILTDADGVIDIDSDTLLTQPNNWASVMISGTSKLTGRVKVRGALYESLSITGTLLLDLDLDIEHPAAAALHAVIGSSLDATSVVKLKGRIDAQDSAQTTVDAVNITAPSGARINTDLDISGIGRRGLSFAGGSIVQVVRGRNRGNFADQVRADAGELEIPAYDFSASGTNCVNTATSATRVTFGKDIRWRGTNTRLANSAAATIVGGEATQNGQAATAGWADGSASLTVHNNPQQIIATTPLTANRTITLSTTNAMPGAWFRVSRTAASTGAFTLDVGGLKLLSTSQWCEVKYNIAGAWTLVANGSL